MSQWAKFLNALESRGLGFDQVKLTSDRRSVITAAGFTDPFDVAIIETEWSNKAGGNVGTAAKRSHVQVSGTVSVGKSIPANDSNEEPAARRSINPTDVRTMPEELQDAVVAEELIHVLMGAAGNLILMKEDNSFFATDAIPIAMRSSVQKALSVANAFQHLTTASTAENHESLGLVSTALGEVVSDVCVSYLAQLGKLHDWARGHSRPLVKIVAEVRRIGHPVQRLSRLLEDIRVMNQGSFPTGGPLLQELHAQLTRASGNVEDEKLLTLVIRRASTPYLAILQKWMHEGILVDRYNEFFVEETRHSALAEDPSTRWEKRFRLVNDRLPKFLSKDKIAFHAYHAGRFRCLLRELNVEPPKIDDQNPLTWGDSEELYRVVRAAFESASSTVISVLFDPTYDLVGHLGSLKHYFLHDKGDWLVDFLDSADELLSKSSTQVKSHSVKVLLQSSIAKTCGADPYCGKVGCHFDHLTLVDRIKKIQVSTQLPPRHSTKIETGRCIDLLQLEYQCTWPLSLIINPMLVANLNCIFRLLLWVKVAERSLLEGWGQKNKEMSGRAVSIKQQMLQFLRQFQFYASHFVIEPLWGSMMGCISEADGVAGICRAVNDFSDKVFDGLILSNMERFAHLGAILSLITKFANVGKFALSGRVPRTMLQSSIADIEPKFLEHLRELANPRTPGYARLIPMLTWMDFSRFYERNQVYRVLHNSGAESEIAQMAGQQFGGHGQHQGNEGGVVYHHGNSSTGGGGGIDRGSSRQGSTERGGQHGDGIIHQYADVEGLGDGGAEDEVEEQLPRGSRGQDTPSMSMPQPR